MYTHIGRHYAIVYALHMQVHNLPKELLSKREVVHVDIVNDRVSQQVNFL